MKSMEIKPCPFCGRHLERADHKGLLYYYHPKCGCLLDYSKLTSEREIELWNRRNGEK